MSSEFFDLKTMMTFVFASYFFGLYHFDPLYFYFFVLLFDATILFLLQISNEGTSQEINKISLFNHFFYLDANSSCLAGEMGRGGELSCFLAREN